MSNPMGSSLRTAAGKRAAGLIPVRLSATILNEYDTRCPEFVPEWLRNVEAGTYWLDQPTAQALYDDARFNADAKNGPEEMDAGTRSAYRALTVQLSRSAAIKVPK
jgi:hypothetical protein